MNGIFRRLWYLINRGRRERELIEEMEFHRVPSRSARVTGQSLASVET